MFRVLLLIACLIATLSPSEDKPPVTSKPAESQPASRPADSRTTLRRPAQAETLRKLLDQQGRPVAIKPRASAEPEAAKEGGAEAAGALVEGTFLVERPGRLVREEGRPRFVFHADGTSPAMQSMAILENQLLETMEREAEAGFSDFIISAEVTRYHGNNYLILRKVLRRTGNGNVAP